MRSQRGFGLMGSGMSTGTGLEAGCPVRCCSPWAFGTRSLDDGAFLIPWLLGSRAGQLTGNETAALSKRSRPRRARVPSSGSSTGPYCPLPPEALALGSESAHVACAYGPLGEGLASSPEWGWGFQSVVVGKPHGSEGPTALFL